MQMDELLRTYDAKVTAPKGEKYFLQTHFYASRIYETVMGE